MKIANIMITYTFKKFRQLDKTCKLISETIIKYTIFSVIQRKERKKKSIEQRRRRKRCDHLQENVAL